MVSDNSVQLEWGEIFNVQMLLGGLVFQRIVYFP